MGNHTATAHRPDFPGDPFLRVMCDIPDIETPRLRLTAFTERHFERYASMLADPACTRWVGDGHALDRMNAWRSMAMLLGHWRLRGFGMWALENRTDGTFVGRAGLLRPEGWPDIELGWMLCTDQRHQGYATEASQAALQFAWDHLHMPRVISLIRPDDESARRVTGRLRGEYVEDKSFLGFPAAVYAYYPPRVPDLQPCIRA